LAGGNLPFAPDRPLSSVLGLFAGLAIFVSCLGLLGLAAFVTSQRTKEIGIRKVLGASVTGITRLLSKDFLRLIVLAALMGPTCPPGSSVSSQRRLSGPTP